MIYFLEGTIELKGIKFAVVAVEGVGYKVFAGRETLRKMPEKGEPVKLWTHEYLREDSRELYGFLHFAELDLFETLIQVPGIGPRTALAVLEVAPIDSLRRAIASGDTSYLTKVSGIGRKTAEKIILELKEKLAGKGVSVEAPELREEVDALDALAALGYSSREARDALSAVPKEFASAEKRIKEALRRLGQSK